MLFNTYIYLLIFLPTVVAIFFLLGRRVGARAQRVWLVCASLFFYGWWEPSYLILLTASIVANFLLGKAISQNPSSNSRKTLYLAGGVVFNVSLLAFFKYTDFLVENVNMLAGTSITQPHIILPLAISFFTFQQIAYIVDISKKQAREASFSRYCLFVCFFPQLIAGPIVHHTEMMPQFNKRNTCSPDPVKTAQGLALIGMGLMKKILIADNLSHWVAIGFNAPESLTFAGAWTTALSYTFQLYFDFCGYMDMATGSALLLNIRLPRNFRSPYKARSIQEFWRRWHITLSRFLRDYIYIPLGGNRKTFPRTLGNVFITFLIGGIWHGAAWTFVVWGALHGAGLVVQRLWERSRFQLPGFLAWLLTFVFVVFCWVFFRADSITDAMTLIARMTGIHGINLPSALISHPVTVGPLTLLPGGTFRSLGIDTTLMLLLAVSFVVTLFMPDSRTIVNTWKPTRVKAILVGCMFAAALILLNQPSEFIYFQF